VQFSLNKPITVFFNNFLFCNTILLFNCNYISSSIHDNFYKTDIVSSSSLNMTKSSVELLDKNPF
jgi:hypothetical protein